MMWVEILSRHHEVLSRHRIDGDTAMIGRGYDNDIIIDDPAINATHLQIARDHEGRLIATDRSGSNAIVDTTQRRSKPTDQIVLSGDTVIGLGNTLLRIRDRHYPVASAIKPDRRLWPLAVSLFLGLQVFIALQAWLELTGESSLSFYTGMLVAINIFLMFWILFWAVLSRVFGGKARFMAHTCFGLTALFILLIGPVLMTIGIFAFSWGWLARYNYVVNTLTVAAICYIHMRLINKTHIYQKAGVCIVLALLTIASITIVNYDKKEGIPPYLARLYPPSLRMVSPQSETGFITKLDDLRTGVDLDRKKAVSAGYFSAIMGIDGDDE